MIKRRGSKIWQAAVKNQIQLNKKFSLLTNGLMFHKTSEEAMLYFFLFIFFFFFFFIVPTEKKDYVLISMELISHSTQDSDSNDKIVWAYKVTTLEKNKAPPCPHCLGHSKNGKESQTVKQPDRTNFKFHNGLPQ